MPIPREARKPPPAVLHYVPALQVQQEQAPAFNPPSRPRMDARLETQAKDIIMANIGTFTKSGEAYTGEIVTMGIQTKNVRILPDDASPNENY